MAIIDVVVPQLSESVSDGTLVEWKKKAGEAVSQDETLIEIETDKVVLEVPCPADGVLSEIIEEDGATVEVGQVLAKIDTEGKAGDTAKSEAADESAKADDAAEQAAPQEEPKGESTSSKAAGVASPAAKKILSEKGVDTADVQGTGRDGRITKDDANKASASSKPAASSSASAPAGSRPEERVPMTRIKARMAERLIQSSNENAILTTFNEVNMKAVMDLRAQYKEQFIKEHGIKLGFMSFFVKAAVHALKKYPIINASIDGKDIVYHGYFDIGVAVGSPRGLVVPVIRDADKLSMADIERKIAEFGAKAKEGKLGLDDLTGGTFTISNGGTFGSMLSTPIINPPQSAILGVHATKERAVVENGEIVIRPVNYLAMSYDHRLIDGREAVLSLVAMKEALEDPQRLLLDL